MIKTVKILLGIGLLLFLESCNKADYNYFEKNIDRKELGYRIEGEEVVFEFDLHEFDQADNGVEQMDFKDLDIKNVAVSGEFNNWSKSGWTMHKVSENIYQLRKNLKDFEDKLEWEYKFIINEAFWVEPPNDAPNRRNDWDSYNNLVLNTTRPSLKGNTTFRLKDYPNANRVFLAGEFNHWNPSELLFGEENGERICRVDLSEGKHTYKFVVDGKWITDPNNPLTEADAEGIHNSVLYLGNPVKFTLKGYTDAKQVILAGSFNNWNETAFVCQKSSEGWTYQINLPKGNYPYKFIVDGHWITDPNNKFYQTDNQGHTNSILVVK